MRKPEWQLQPAKMGRRGSCRRVYTTAKPRRPLAPVASPVRIMAVIVVSPARHPPGMKTRRPRPIARRPDVTPAPIVKAIDPNIARPRCITHYAHDGRRWRRSRYVVTGANRTTGKKKHREGRYQKCPFHMRPFWIYKRGGRTGSCGLHLVLMIARAP